MRGIKRATEETETDPNTEISNRAAQDIINASKTKRDKIRHKSRLRTKGWGRSGNPVLCYKVRSKHIDLNHKIFKLLERHWPTDSIEYQIYLYYRDGDDYHILGRVGILNGIVVSALSLKNAHNIYTGQIQDGTYHGKGVLRIDQGNIIYDGTFECGKPKSGTLTYKVDNIIYHGIIGHDKIYDVLYPNECVEYINNSSKDAVITNRLMFDGACYWQSLTKIYSGTYAFNRGLFNRNEGTEYTSNGDVLYDGTYDNNGERKS